MFALHNSSKVLWKDSYVHTAFDTTLGRDAASASESNFTALGLCTLVIFEWFVTEGGWWMFE